MIYLIELIFVEFLWTNFSLFFYSLVIAIISIIFVSKYAKKQRDEFGKQLPTFYISLGLIIGLPLLTFLFGGVSLSFEIPELEQLSTTVYVYKGGVSHSVYRTHTEDKFCLALLDPHDPCSTKPSVFLGTTK